MAVNGERARRIILQGTSQFARRVDRPSPGRQDHIADLQPPTAGGTDCCNTCHDERLTAAAE
jgi:hypothetical protein